MISGRRDILMLKRMNRKQLIVKYICVFMCLVLTAAGSAAVFAEEEGAEEAALEAAVGEAVAEVVAAVEGAEGTAEAESAPAPETVVSSVIRTNELEGWPDAADKASDYLCLLDTTTDTVLIDKNMDLQTSPASLTKLMTILVALENGNLDDKVTMTQTGVDYAVAGSANLYTVVGEEFTLRDMLYGIMLASANDMAEQVAEYVGGGSVDNFVAMMNEKAEALGCTGTHFVNATGMPADGQLSTAHDMAIICEEALKNPTFKEIASAKTYTIPATTTYAPRELTNNFPLFADPATYKIKGVYGGKTGYTDAAQNCLAAFCDRSGRGQICIALHCNDLAAMIDDADKAFQYGYYKWKLRQVTPPEGQELAAGGSVLTPKKKEIEDCTTTETVSDEADGRERVDTVYYWSGVPVGTSSILRVKPTPEPTSVPEPVVQETAVSAAAPAAGTESMTALPAAATPEPQTSEKIQAAEPKAVLMVTLPFGISMNRSSFIAIAVLSLLILLGIILILLTAVFRKHNE